MSLQRELGDAILKHKPLWSRPPDDLCDWGDNVWDPLDLDAISQNDSHVSLILRKDNARAVKQPDVGVEVHLLSNFGHTRGSPNVHGFVSLQRVDQAALADVGVPGHANDNGRLRSASAEQVLNEGKQSVPADGEGG